MTEGSKEIAENPSGTDGAPQRLSREDMLDQLEVMARQIASDAPPALREATAVAAELAATAARGTGPVAHTLADLTDDASLRFAERMETYARSVRDADVNGADLSDSAVTDDGSSTEAIDRAETEDRE
jgi:hypothetical protein